MNAWTCNKRWAPQKVIYVGSQGDTVQTLAPPEGGDTVCMAGVGCVGKAIGLKSLGIGLVKPCGER